MLPQELRNKLESTNYSDLKTTLDSFGLGSAFEAGKKKPYIIDRALELLGGKVEVPTDTKVEVSTVTDVPDVTVITETVTPTERPKITLEAIEDSIAITKANLAQASDAQKEAYHMLIAKLENLKKTL